MTAHGGDVWQVADEFGIDASEILDFSANINPRGLPVPARALMLREAADASLTGRYPDPEARRLRRALSERLGVPVESITVGPGAEALLAPALRAMQARRALVPVPAFSEYRRACKRTGVEFVPFPLDRSELFRLHAERFCERIETGLAILNHPHNPSGATLEAGIVPRVLDRAGMVLLDEAFIDYAPEASFVRDAARCPGLVVIRSLTKFYGCPALRVGYMVGHPETVARIREFSDTWAVSQLAMDTIVEALADSHYAAASRLENETARSKLSCKLRELGLFVFPSAANYLLLELGENMVSSSLLRERLIANHRILVRNCDSYEGLERNRFVRVAVRSPEENERLVKAVGVELGLA